MAITRSRTLPPRVTSKNTIKEQKTEKIIVSKKKLKNVSKSTKEPKSTKSKAKNIAKSIFGTNKNKTKQKKLKKNDISIDPSTKTDLDENPDKDLESKGKRLPAYKIEQLQRLQRLIDMSSVAKPRGPITADAFKLKQEKNLLQLNISLDRSNKKKISNITNYDPIRKKLLNNQLTSNEKQKINEKYEKIQKYKNVKVPNISNDLYLKEVLNEIYEKNKHLRIGNSFVARLKEEKYGNHSLFENEKKLNLFDLTEEQRENLLGQQLENALDFNITPCQDNNIKKTSEIEYEKIEIDRVAHCTKLEVMLKDSKTQPKNGNDQLSEDMAFDGLKLEDFTLIRKFGNGKV